MDGACNTFFFNFAQISVGLHYCHKLASELDIIMCVCVCVILTCIIITLWKKKSTCKTEYELHKKVQELNVNLACPRMFQYLH
jgi:hypothetical protein